MSPQSPEQVLVTLSGPQSPQSLSHVLHTLGHHPLADFAQLTTHNRFVSTALVSSSRVRDIVKDALFHAHQLSLPIQFSVLPPNTAHQPSPPSSDYAITLFALSSVHLDVLAKVLQLVAQYGGSVLHIHPLTTDHDHGMCLEVRVKLEGDVEEFRKSLFELAKRGNECDVAIQRAGIMRRAKRLVVFDLSWTLINADAMDIVLQAAQLKPPYPKPLEERIASLKGVSVDDVSQNIKQLLVYTHGAKELCQRLKQLGCRLAIVSSGSRLVAEMAKDHLEMDYAFGNTLHVDANGNFTGKISLPVVDKDRKKDLVCMLAVQESVAMEQVVVVGDGPVSAEMLSVAGIGVAFEQPVSTDDVRGARIASRSLLGVHYLLGLSGGDMG